MLRVRYSYGIFCRYPLDTRAMLPQNIWEEIGWWRGKVEVRARMICPSDLWWLYCRTPLANMKDIWKYVGSGVIIKFEMDVSILESKDSKNEL